MIRWMALWEFCQRAVRPRAAFQPFPHEMRLQLDKKITGKFNLRFFTIDCVGSVIGNQR